MPFVTDYPDGVGLRWEPKIPSGKRGHSAPPDHFRATAEWEDIWGAAFFRRTKALLLVVFQQNIHYSLRRRSDSERRSADIRRCVTAVFSPDTRPWSATTPAFVSRRTSARARRSESRRRTSPATRSRTTRTARSWKRVRLFEWTLKSPVSPPLLKLL